MGIMIHSLVIGLTLAIASGSEFSESPSPSGFPTMLPKHLLPPPLPASLVTAISFHQLFEGLSLGIRIASLPRKAGTGGFSILKVTLMILFAITTPIGIIIGMIVFPGDADVGKSFPFFPPRVHIAHLTSPPSAHETNSRPPLRALRRDAHLRCMRGDASRGFCHGFDPLEESRLEAMFGSGEFGSGSHWDEYYWVSVLSSRAAWA